MSLTFLRYYKLMKMVWYYRENCNLLLLRFFFFNFHAFFYFLFQFYLKRTTTLSLLVLFGFHLFFNTTQLQILLQFVEFPLQFCNICFIQIMNFSFLFVSVQGKVLSVQNDGWVAHHLAVQLMVCGLVFNLCS